MPRPPLSVLRSRCTRQAISTGPHTERLVRPMAEALPWLLSVHGGTD